MSHSFGHISSDVWESQRTILCKVSV